MSQNNSLQNIFLNALRQEKTPLTVFLVNGVKLQGMIAGFDHFCILLKSDGRKPQLVYKHAVSTIAPSLPVNLTQNPESHDFS